MCRTGTVVQFNRSIFPTRREGSPKKKIEGFIGPKNTKKERLKLRLSRLRHSFQKSRTDTTYSQEEGFLYFVSALFILLSNSEGRQS